MKHQGHNIINSFSSRTIYGLAKCLANQEHLHFIHHYNLLLSEYVHLMHELKTNSFVVDQRFS